MKQAGSAPNIGPGRSLPTVSKALKPDPDVMEVDDEKPNRERADRESVARLDRERRRLESQYEDGRYGFPERSDPSRFDIRRDQNRDRGGLYSDSMVRRPYRQ